MDAKACYGPMDSVAELIAPQLSLQGLDDTGSARSLPSWGWVSWSVMQTHRGQIIQQKAESCQSRL